MIKELSLSPALTSILKKVLEPPAEVLGKELATTLRSAIKDYRESRRSKNLSRHIEGAKVEATKPRRPPKSPKSQKPAQMASEARQVELLSEWTERAQDVSEEEQPEIARMWQRLLADILHGHDIEKRLLDMLGQLDADEALFLTTHFCCDANGFYTYSHFPQHGDSPFLGRWIFKQFASLNDRGLYARDRLMKLGVLDSSFRRFLPFSSGTGFSSIRLSWMGQQLMKYAPERPAPQDQDLPV